MELNDNERRLLRLAAMVRGIEPEKALAEAIEQYADAVPEMQVIEHEGGPVYPLPPTRQQRRRFLGSGELPGLDEQGRPEPDEPEDALAAELRSAVEDLDNAAWIKVGDLADRMGRVAGGVSKQQASIALSNELRTVYDLRADKLSGGGRAYRVRDVRGVGTP